ncbi:MAG: NAD(P)H-hydrate dehydratase [Phycisphaerae bacterium]|jgi:NAD(P)H-hydrate epimerase
MAGEIEKVTRLAKLPPRRRDAHKGSFGHVLVVGGSGGMMGAVALAANAALRGGAGLVTFAAPRTIQPYVATICPCATSIPLACDDRGELAPESLAQLAEAAQVCSVLAIGPGIAVGSTQRNIIRWALEQALPTVIDADGLNNLAGIDGWAKDRRCPLILTPHPGEFSRLTGRDVADIQAHREEAAVAAAREWAGQASGEAGEFVCVLKGVGTIVTDGRRVYANDTGNPGMATGGTGDVLTGLTAALLGQHLAPFEAACLAVHCHGLAGDLAAARLGQPSLLATDLVNYFPEALKEAVG